MATSLAQQAISWLVILSFASGRQLYAREN